MLFTKMYFLFPAWAFDDVTKIKIIKSEHQ